MPYCTVFLGVNFCMPYCIVFLGVIEKSCQKLVLRVSSEVPNTCFSVFGNPDETLELVFDILRREFGKRLTVLVNDSYRSRFIRH